MNKHVTAGIGALAFVIGGLMARSKALDGIETLEARYLSKNQDDAPQQEEN